MGIDPSAEKVAERTAGGFLHSPDELPRPDGAISRRSLEGAKAAVQGFFSDQISEEEQDHGGFPVDDSLESPEVKIAQSGAERDRPVVRHALRPGNAFFQDRRKLVVPVLHPQVANGRVLREPFAQPQVVVGGRADGVPPPLVGDFMSQKKLPVSGQIHRTSEIRNPGRRGSRPRLIEDDEGSGALPPRRLGDALDDGQLFIREGTERLFVEPDDRPGFPGQRRAEIADVLGHEDVDRGRCRVLVDGGFPEASDDKGQALDRLPSLENGNPVADFLQRQDPADLVDFLHAGKLSVGHANVAGREADPKPGKEIIPLGHGRVPSGRRRVEIAVVEEIRSGESAVFRHGVARRRGRRKGPAVINVQGGRFALLQGLEKPEVKKTVHLVLGEEQLAPRGIVDLENIQAGMEIEPQVVHPRRGGFQPDAGHGRKETSVGLEIQIDVAAEDIDFFPQGEEHPPFAPLVDIRRIEAEKLVGRAAPEMDLLLRKGGISVSETAPGIGPEFKNRLVALRQDRKPRPGDRIVDRERAAVIAAEQSPGFCDLPGRTGTGRAGLGGDFDAVRKERGRKPQIGGNQRRLHAFGLVPEGQLVALRLRRREKMQPPPSEDDQPRPAVGDVVVKNPSVLEYRFKIVMADFDPGNPFDPVRGNFQLEKNRRVPDHALGPDDPPLPVPGQLQLP